MLDTIAGGSWSQRDGDIDPPPHTLQRGYTRDDDADDLFTLEDFSASELATIDAYKERMARLRTVDRLGRTHVAHPMSEATRARIGRSVKYRHSLNIIRSALREQTIDDIIRLAASL
jgi:hypothetical protein